MTIRRRLVATAVAGAAAVALAGCGSSEGPNPTPAPVPGASGGSLKIGIPFDEPGIGLKDGTKYTGFDVETATYVAKALGVAEGDITWVETTGDQRQQALTSGQVDLVFSTFTITDERKQVVDFAGPYFQAHQDLLVRRNDTEITGPDTLDGKVLCTVAGTTSADNIQQRYEGRITVKELGRYSDCVQSLAASQVDAVTTDDVILAGYAAQPQYQGLLKVVGDGFSDENYGVGVKKGDTAMVQKVNAALKQYVDDGSWKRALNISVAPSGYSIPGPPTVTGS
jgi:glutamate transport system substrate-binding protein